MPGFRCFFGLHNLKIISCDRVINSKNQDVGKVYTLQCEHCGSLFTEYVKLLKD